MAKQGRSAAVARLTRMVICCTNSAKIHARAALKLDPQGNLRQFLLPNKSEYEFPLQATTMALTTRTGKFRFKFLKAVLKIVTIAHRTWLAQQ